MNAPVVQYNDKSAPENVLKNFPEAFKKTSNGCITFKIADSHIKKGMEQPLS